MHRITKLFARFAFGASAASMVLLPTEAAEAHSTLDGSRDTLYAPNHCNTFFWSGYAISPYYTVGQVTSVGFHNENTLTGLSGTWRVKLRAGTHGPSSLVLLPRQERWHNGAIFGEEPMDVQVTINPYSDNAFGNSKIFSNLCK